MFAKILALYDFSLPSQRALAWAARLSSSFGSDLSVVTVMGREERRFYPEASNRQLEDLVRQDVDRHVRRISDREEKPGIKRCEISVVSGTPSSDLLKIIEKQNPDVTVIGSHGRTGLSRVLLGSVAERVVRYATSPVLVARTDPAWPPSRILVPLDFSDSDEESLLAAADLKSIVASDFDLLHVLSYREIAGVVYPEAVIAWTAGDRSEKEKEAEKRLKEIAARHPQLQATPLVAVGHPVSEILDKARARAADLILIATHGRTGLPRLLMGSVAEQVVRYAPCSVLSFSPKRAAGARREAVRTLTQPNDAGLAEFADGE